MSGNQVTSEKIKCQILISYYPSSFVNILCHFYICFSKKTYSNLFLGTENEEESDSQNHRMLGVGRDLCGSSSPTVLPKKGHLQQATQDLVQAGLEYLQRRRLHNLLGQPVPGLCHPQREEVLPHVQTELPVLQFVPIAPCPVTGHH